MRSKGMIGLLAYEEHLGLGSLDGASQGRPNEGDPSDDIRGINQSSSRGPTADGRLCPTVVAPGTNVVSALTTILKTDGFLYAFMVKWLQILMKLEILYPKVFLEKTAIVLMLMTGMKTT